MKNENSYPPNFLKIQATLNPQKGAVYAYGDTIYNPDNITLYEDLVKHEEVHKAQQEKLGNIEVWWDEYLTNPKFRLEQELEAYNKQYLFLKNIIRNKELKEALQEMAHALSHDYGLDITYNQAESRIKKYAKT